MIIVLLFLVAIICAGLGMFYKERIIRSILKLCFKTILSREEQFWLLENGAKYKTFSEAQNAWFESGGFKAAEEKAKAEKWYASFLKSLGEKLPAIPDGRSQ